MIVSFFFKCVVFLILEKSDREDEIIRLISTRKAEKYEEKIYAAHIQNQSY